MFALVREAPGKVGYTDILPVTEDDLLLSDAGVVITSVTGDTWSVIELNDLRPKHVIKWGTFL